MLSATYRLDRRSRNDSEGFSEPTCIAAFSTDLNWMAIAWREDTLLANTFGYPSRRLSEVALAREPGLPQSFCRVRAEGQVGEMPQWAANLVAKLKLYAAGEKVSFEETPLSLEHLTTFGKRVIAACRRIPWGETRSYGELAAECGSPGAARAVGSVMAKNRYPLIVPCHRVIGSSGKLTGFAGGLKVKAQLLTLEGGKE